MVRILAFLFTSVILLSCGKSSKIEEAVQEKPTEFKTAVKFTPVTPINQEVRKELRDWEEYRTLETFINRFPKSSPEEILSNALELRDLVKAAKFSNKIPELFNITPIKARFNILYNQTLRLADMTFIPAIQASEVIEEYEKILLSFSSLNSRFVSVVTKKRFEDEIDIDVTYIGLDSTKIDSISKKTISKSIEDKKLEKQQEQIRKKKKGSKNVKITDIPKVKSKSKSKN